MAAAGFLSDYLSGPLPYNCKYIITIVIIIMIIIIIIIMIIMIIIFFKYLFIY